MFAEEKYVIGLCGYKGCGKSTLAKFLGFPTIAFAAPIKRGLEAMGVPPQYLHDPELKEAPLELLGGLTVRHAMTTLGTQWGQEHMGEDFWVNLWHNAVSQVPTQVVLCDDVRFPKEVQAIRRYSRHRLVFIDRPGCGPGEHSSEQLNPHALGIPIIRNVGTKEHLFYSFATIG
jgi:hypothetical protein